jgi:hypothetical protein
MSSTTRLSPSPPVGHLSDTVRDITLPATPGKLSLVSEPLSLHCDCEDGWVWQGRRGPNDPDGDMERCEAPGCESGVIHLRCDTPGCVGEATAVVDGECVCEPCAAHVRAEADLAAIEALTDHCRAREHAIPFTVLYTAVAAVQRLRGRP